MTAPSVSTPRPRSGAAAPAAPDRELWTQLYGDMLRIRLVEEGIAELYPKQQIRCPVHLCVGQEAVPAGVCAALTARDYVMSAHRSHGHYLSKGGSLKALMAELYGKATGCSRGKGGSMHLVDLSVGFLGATPIVGATISITVGTALASVMRGEPRVSVIFFGDAAPESGTWHESLSFAALKRLPVVFVCENNLYSTMSSLAVRQPSNRTIIDLARGHGVEAHHGDGNDAPAVHALAQRAVQKARGGGGPTVLEFATYRWREHCGPNFDTALGYRTEQELREWQQRCPIRRLQDRLAEAGLWDERERAQAERRVREEFAEAVAFAEAGPFPDPRELMEHVYAP